MDLGAEQGRIYLLDRSEYRQTEMCLTGLLWRDTPDHLGPERQCLLYMESSLFSPIGWVRRISNPRNGALTVFPVNPWQITLVSLWTTRFWMVLS
jgi:hypothetical protein